jgi:hypothetical protein
MAARFSLEMAAALGFKMSSAPPIGWNAASGMKFALGIARGEFALKPRLPCV